MTLLLRLPLLLQQDLQGKSSAKRKAHEHKLFRPVALGTIRVCPRGEPRLVPYLTQWKPSLPQGQTLFALYQTGVEGWQLKSMYYKFMCLCRSLERSCALAAKIIINKNFKIKQTSKIAQRFLMRRLLQHFKKNHFSRVVLRREGGLRFEFFLPHPLCPL